MSACPACAVAAACLVAGVLLGAAGCSAVGSAPTGAAAARPLGPPVKRVVQVSYGADATFAVCVEPACPRVTPKTLAPEDRAGLGAMGIAAGMPTAGLGVAGAFRASPAEPAAQVVVTFASGSAALADDGKAALRAALARYGKARRIMLAGRTDSTGSVAGNKVLARARATAVRDYLVGLAPGLHSVVQVEAQGTCCLKAASDSEAGRARNRRVEVTFLGGGA